jgi:hypothetical protein
VSHLYFNELNNEGKKTRIWEVMSTATDEVLGKIKFRGAWRKYIYEPSQYTLYDASCLREISDFTESRTKEWRESLATLEANSGS